MPIFECDIPNEKIIDPLTITGIVSSQSFYSDIPLKDTKHKLFNEPEVKKYFIPVDCSYWDLDVITYVEAGTIIPKHAHDEPVLRYVLEGQLELNGVLYEVGDWIIVPKGFPYQIQTKTGYKILSRYSANCAECTWKSLSKMPLEKMKS